MHKPRTRVTMNTRTEAHADRRTRRQRTRAAEEMHALLEEAQLIDDGTCRAGWWCVQHDREHDLDWVAP